ncbi:ABC transporter permease [Pontibacter korlensis]|uniref:ABC transmembrane type-1 domain-containing protein n=1 Tax=Pontibacter korlensis TaxID=400092 RepID=A0A0E3ZF83_9BACT|nr:ABC transporter permease [Pontibacter korlensis]AKD04163.1 hypothetical protein PKOR_15055 [Pontibacter korlensis]
MFVHLLRKLLLAIPALWIIGTLVFLLSRMLPGSFGQDRILDLEGSFYSKSSQGSREAAYKAYLQKTGQHLPLFYFSISPSVVPDTLSLIFPEQRQEQLRQLAYKYGNWPVVVKFNVQARQLEQSFKEHKTPEIELLLQTLGHSSDLEQLRHACSNLQRLATNTAVSDKAGRVAYTLEALVEKQQRFAYLLPDLNWHGPENQYHRWLTAAIAGDFGTSYRTGRSVLEMIGESIGNTLLLLLGSMLITLALSLELSIQMVKGSMRWLRNITMPLLFLIDSMPTLIIAMLLLVLLANPDFLQLFPVYGMGYYTSESLPFWQQLFQQLQFMALPLVVMVLANLPYITNQLYSSLHAAMLADYSRTARAKGLSENKVIRQHALRNALLPLITLVSDFLPALVSGSILIETIFAIPGIGRLLIDSVLSKDYPVLIAIVLVVLIVRIVAYALADLAYAWADPRLKQKLV